MAAVPARPRINRRLEVASAWVHTVAMGTWLGGIVMVALSAPLTFHVLEAAHPAGVDPRLLAGAIVGGTLQRFNGVTYACATLMLAADGVALAAGRLDARWKAALTTLLLASALALGFVMFPHLLADRATGEMADFDRLHSAYASVVNVQLLLLLAVAFPSPREDASCPVA